MIQTNNVSSKKIFFKKKKTTTTICSIKKKHYYFLRDQSIQTLLGDFPAQRICQLSKSLKATFGSLCFWSNINTSYLKLRYFPLTVVLSDHRPSPPTTTVGVLSPQTHSGAVKSCSGSSWVVRTRAALESISHRSKKFRSCGNSKHGWRAIFLFIYLFIFPPFRTTHRRWTQRLKCRKAQRFRSHECSEREEVASTYFIRSKATLARIKNQKSRKKTDYSGK